MLSAVMKEKQRLEENSGESSKKVRIGSRFWDKLKVDFKIGQDVKVVVSGGREGIR
jgi:hypothetical protein